jgi:hypothetical protein
MFPYYQWYFLFFVLYNLSGELFLVKTTAKANIIRTFFGILLEGLHLKKKKFDIIKLTFMTLKSECGTNVR